jgi:hypothetical protein
VYSHSGIPEKSGMLAAQACAQISATAGWMPAGFVQNKPFIDSHSLRASAWGMS